MTGLVDLFRRNKRRYGGYVVHVALVLIGTHLGENMHNLQVQEFANAVERRIPIIVVDPRFSVAASKAKYWLPVKPGTDLALLLAWCNLLVTEGRYDKAFVEAHGHGFVV